MKSITGGLLAEQYLPMEVLQEAVETLKAACSG